MREIPVSKLKTNFSAVMEDVRKTRKPVRVTRRGRPIAEIVPVKKEEKRKSVLGCMRGTAEIVGDIVGPHRSIRKLGLSDAMKLLLDTHIWLWMILSPEKLTLAVRRQLDSPKNQLFLSPVSVWEAHHVFRRKRVRLVGDNLSEWINQAVVRGQLHEASFNFAVAAQAGQITLPQSDVGDVFIAATACAYDLTLVTADEQLLACSWLKTLPNE